MHNIISKLLSHISNNFRFSVIIVLMIVMQTYVINTMRLGSSGDLFGEIIFFLILEFNVAIWLVPLFLNKYKLIDSWTFIFSCTGLLATQIGIFFSIMIFPQSSTAGLGALIAPIPEIIFFIIGLILGKFANNEFQNMKNNYGREAALSFFIFTLLSFFMGICYLINI